MTEDELQAEEVREVLDRMYEMDSVDLIDNFEGSVEEFARLIVEEGELFPDDENLVAGIPLSLKERIKGERRQPMKGAIGIGLLIGTALERDIPMDSDIEDMWRDGEMTLPEKDPES